MFLISRFRVVLTFLSFCITKCLAFPLEDAVDARFLHARQVATATAVTNILTTAENTSVPATNTLISATSTSATAAAVKVDDSYVGNIVPAVADGQSTSPASLATTTGNTDASSGAAVAHWAVVPGSGTGLAVLVSEPSASSTSAAASTTTTDYSFVTVAIVQPSLCTVSVLQYSTKTAIPTGQVQIFPDRSVYWGATGSIWNFTLDDGVQFSNLTANCQGSLCSDYGSQDEVSGSIVENPDGVW